MSVYANLIKLVMKTVFTKQLGPEIFRPIVASFCVTSESIKLIVIKLLIFLCNMEWWESFHASPFYRWGEYLFQQVATSHAWSLLPRHWEKQLEALYSPHYFICWFDFRENIYLWLKLDFKLSEKHSVNKNIFSVFQASSLKGESSIAIQVHFHFLCDFQGSQYSDLGFSTYCRDSIA